MKTRMEILTTENAGDAIKLTGQAFVGLATYAACRTLTIYVPNTAPNRAAYRVGRVIDVTTKPVKEAPSHVR